MKNLKPKKNEWFPKMRYVAQDKNGNVFQYQYKPKKYVNSWQAGDGEIKAWKKLDENPNWDSTLIKKDF